MELTPDLVGPSRARNAGIIGFAEFTDVCQRQADFEAKVETAFNKMIAVGIKHKAA